MKKKKVRPPRQNVWVRRAVMRGIRTGCRCSQTFLKMRSSRDRGVSEKSCRNIDVQIWEDLTWILISVSFCFCASLNMMTPLAPSGDLQIVRRLGAGRLNGRREQHRLVDVDDAVLIQPDLAPVHRPGRRARDHVGLDVVVAAVARAAEAVLVAEPARGAAQARGP